MASLSPSPTRHSVPTSGVGVGSTRRPSPPPRSSRTHRSPQSSLRSSPSWRRGQYSPPPPPNNRRGSPPPRGSYSRSRSRSLPRPRSPPYRTGRRHSDSSETNESTNLFVGNLAFHIQEANLRELMERCGHVKGVTVGINRRTGQSKGYGFVEFENRRDAEAAYERYQGVELHGRRLRIDWDMGIDKKMNTARFKQRRPPARGNRYSRSISPRNRGGTGGGRYGSPRRRSSSRSPLRSRSNSYSPPPLYRRRSPRRRSESSSPRRRVKRSRSPRRDDSRSPKRRNDQER